jgi:hypothetical protein
VFSSKSVPPTCLIRHPHSPHLISMMDVRASLRQGLAQFDNLGLLRSPVTIRHQMIAFTILILECLRQGRGQFLLETVRQKDTYGTNEYIIFWDLWDVEYWNSSYPQLPRLVRLDPILHERMVPDPGRQLDAPVEFQNLPQSKPSNALRKTTSAHGCLH